MCWRKVIKMIQWLTLSKKTGVRCEESGIGEGLPEVRDQVNLEHIKEAELSDRAAQRDGPDKDADIRHNYLHPLLRRENCCVWVKI